MIDTDRIGLDINRQKIQESAERQSEVRAAALAAQSQGFNDTAEALALCARALAAGDIPVGQQYAAVQRVLYNAELLAAWVSDDRC